MMIVVLGLFAILTVEVWGWTACYLGLGVITELEPALTLATTVFAAVGFGGVAVPSSWRLLAALEGVDGILLIGWSTAYLVSAGTQVGPFRIGEHF